MLVFILFGSVFAFVFVAGTKTKGLDRLESKMILVENLLSGTNAAFLYEWDIRQVEKNILPFVVDSEIYSIHVQGADGYIDIFVGEEGAAETNVALISRDIDVFYRGQSVGNIIATFSTAPITAQIRGDVFRFIAACIVLMATLCLTLLFFIRRIIQPVSELTALTCEIASGNLEQKIELQQGGEIGLLAASFTQMQTAIKGMLESHKMESAKNRRSAQLSLKHQEAILEISTEASRGEAWQKWIALVTKKAAEVLDVDRVSFWLFNEDYSEFSCVDLYQRKDGSHSSGAVIHKDHCSAYFEAIFAENILVIDDAGDDPRMAGMVDWYCRPQNIFSLLDITIWFQGKMIGILCLEYVGEPRTWIAEEVLCVERFSDQITLLLSEIYERYIGQMNKILINALDPEELLEDAIAGIRTIFDCDRVGVMHELKRTGDTERSIRFTASADCPLPLFQDPEDAFFCRLAAILEGVIPGEYATTGRDNIPDSLKEYDLSSFLVTNLQQRDERLSVVLQTCHQERTWYSYDKVLLHDIVNRLRERLSRLNMGRELRIAEQYISSIIDSMPSTLIGVDAAGRITHWNQTARDVSGFSVQDVIGVPLASVMPEFASYMDEIGLSIKEQQVHSYTKQTQKNKSAQIIENITIFPLITEKSEGAVIRIDDVTRERQLENQLNQQRKMEAIGTLAGGVAHDFNNMLGAIIGGVEMISRHLPEDPKIAKYAKVIKGSAITAADLTKQLLTFSRRSGQDFAIIDLHDVINMACTLLQRTIDPRVSFSFDLVAAKSVIAGDSSNLENMILNLGINAAHAMPDGGKIYFSTEVVELDSQFCRDSVFAIEPGTYIRTAVSDTGIGISPEHLDKVFEPFFTTKGVDKGTGLGLASVYGAVQQHKGAIHVDSEEGKGSCFSILLPLVDGELTAQKLRTASGPGGKKGEGCILVVDDENLVRIMAQEILESFGFEVLAANNGRQALEIYREQAQKIRLVLLDNTMPEMNGKDCLIELKKIDPQVRIIMVSGNTQEQDQQELKALGLNQFLNKPYFADELESAVFATLA
jgi:PAS domain S-box-containing protein